MAAADLMRVTWGVVAVLPLLLLGACNPPGDGDNAVAPAAATARPVAAVPTAKPMSAANVSQADPCPRDAPQSPCPVVGHWRVVKVYNPANVDPTADEMGMIGAKLTLSDNGDASGALRWDGPDNGQFDISDVCTGPYLSEGPGTPDPHSRATLTKALTAWGAAGNAAAARHLGCDSGHWTVPSDPSGEWYGLVLPMGRGMAFEWFDDRFVLAERID